MNNRASNKTRYEYHLSFLQVFFNPPGMFVYRCFALSLLLFLIYQSVTRANASELIPLYVIEIFVLLTATLNMFLGHTRWRPEADKLWIEFTDTGVATNYCQGEGAGRIELNTIEYRYLHLRHGLLGTFLLYSPAHSGMFILIRSDILPWQEIEARLPAMARKGT